MLKRIRRVLYSESGQGMAEYALILVLVAIACLAVTKGLGNNIVAKLNEASNKISGASL